MDPGPEDACDDSVVVTGLGHVLRAADAPAGPVSGPDDPMPYLRVKKLLPPIPEPKCIYHYSYIAMRPDRRRKLPAMHPQRVAEWDAEFADIAQLAET